MNRGNRKTFAGRYYCYNLVYYEEFQWIRNAIAREKEIKGWRRRKKVELINASNPDWTFLNSEICGKWPPEMPPSSA
jgi:putative endonuclease